MEGKAIRFLALLLSVALMLSLAACGMNGGKEEEGDKNQDGETEDMQTTLYMLSEQGPKQMMSYVLQTKEGKLAVIDGGNKVDANDLIDTLVRLGGPKPVVELWLVTHPHGDHVDALLEIFSRPDNPIQVEKIYTHFLSYEYYKDKDSASAANTKRFQSFQEEHPDICFSFEKGQELMVGSARFTVLYVPEEIFSANVGNNSSVVFRLDAEGQRVLFLGDLGEEGGDYVLEHVPAEELKADFVQMAHHGQNGVKKNFYEVVSPKACLWNTPQWLWDNNKDNAGYNTGSWQTLVVRSWMSELMIEHHFVTKDGLQTIPLPYPL